MAMKDGLLVGANNNLLLGWKVVFLVLISDLNHYTLKTNPLDRPGT